MKIPAWMHLVEWVSQINAPPSRLHGYAHYDPQRARVLFAVVPLNWIIAVATTAWEYLRNPYRIMSYIRRDDATDRLRRVEAELRHMKHAAHNRGLAWDGQQFIDYGSAWAVCHKPQDQQP